MTALPTLFQIDKLYPPGSDNHCCFCFLADPFVDGPTRVDLPGKRLSTMKKLLEKQYKEEAISLIRMILLDCGDRNSSDLLKEFDKSKEIIRTVGDLDMRKMYNFRCLLVKIACKLDTQTSDMVTFLQEEIGCYESAENDFQTLLLLLVRAHQRNIILPHNLGRLKQWLALSVFKRDDLIQDVDHFEQFLGLGAPVSESSTNSGINRLCSEATGQICTINMPTSPQSVKAADSLAKQPGVYAEEGTDKTLQDTLLVDHLNCTDISGDILLPPSSSESIECQLHCEVFNKRTRERIRCHSVYRDIKIKVNTVQPGTPLLLKVSTRESCYIYIINIGNSGNITTLIPNDCDQNNHLQSGQCLLFPSPESGYDFELDETCGRETIVVLAYKERLDDVEQAKIDYANLVKKERDIRIVKKHSLKGFLEIQFTVSQ